MPTSAPGLAARMACTASPWPSSRWWVAASAWPRSVSAGGVNAVAVAEPGAAPRLVQRDPLADAVAECRRDHPRVLGEPARGVAGGPATRVLQRLRQVPVVQREGRLDAALAQAVDQATVEVQAGLVGRALAVRLDARPGHREPVGADAKLGEQVEIGVEPPVVVAGHVAGVAVAHLARGVAEGVPDRVAPAVGLGRPLDLIGGGGRAEQEIAGNRDRGGAVGNSAVGNSRRRKQRLGNMSSKSAKAGPLSVQIVVLNRYSNLTLRRQ